MLACGFTQKLGIDYKETFSPIIKIARLCILIALATIYNLEVHQMDVITIFLHGLLNKEIYISQPPIYEVSSQKRKVCHLL